MTLEEGSLYRPQFEPHTQLSAHDKHEIFADFQNLLLTASRLLTDSGFYLELDEVLLSLFTDQLYDHLINHCNFPEFGDKGVFLMMFFHSPFGIVQFFNHFEHDLTYEEHTLDLNTELRNLVLQHKHTTFQPYFSKARLTTISTILRLMRLYRITINELIDHIDPIL